MRKPDFCICENKDADQLAVTAKLISAFVFATQIVQSLYFLIRNFKPPAILCGCTVWFVWDLIGNPEDRFSHNEAHITVCPSVISGLVLVILQLITTELQPVGRKKGEKKQAELGLSYEG